jgi:hypothetical protein
VGLFPTGAAPSGYLNWFYLNGTKVAGSGATTATLQFVAPATPGTYHARLYAMNGYTLLATSATITVVP